MSNLSKSIEIMKSYDNKEITANNLYDILLVVEQEIKNNRSIRELKVEDGQSIGKMAVNLEKLLYDMFIVISENSNEMESAFINDIEHYKKKTKAYTDQVKKYNEELDKVRNRMEEELNNKNNIENDYNKIKSDHEKLAKEVAELRSKIENYKSIKEEFENSKKEMNELENEMKILTPAIDGLLIEEKKAGSDDSIHELLAKIQSEQKEIDLLIYSYKEKYMNAIKNIE